MTKFLLLFMAVFISADLMSQEYIISGNIIDELTEEPLIGASIFSGTQGSISDIDGRYSISLPAGEHVLSFSYVGYIKKELTLQVTGDQIVDISLGNLSIQEVIVTADIAIDRKTPVAFSNVPTKRIDEELSSQDLPMLLNSTPGIYATQQGGGDGDARVSIRGFSQNNIAVMLDGVPVNDMENGAVFWSNWFGLDMITQTMQVQRGLGSSKLSIPAVGGTINILTKGIESRRSLRIKQEIANDNFYRTSLAFNSGKSKKNFGVSGAFSYKEGDGWVDGNFTRGFFYYLKLEKQMGKHLLSLSGFGAPQEHGQRSFQMAMATIDTSYAREQGIPSEFIYGPNNDVPSWNQSGLDRGRKYNQHTGYRNGELINTRKNIYHKPQITLRHSAQLNEKIFLSNIAYVSIGRGGGVRNDGENWGNYLIPETGTFDIDSVYAYNRSTSLFRPEPFSEEFLSISKNEHAWYGLLSSMSIDINENLRLSPGVDIRYYRGDHYNEVYDLMGGDYVTKNANEGNSRIDIENARTQEGDIIQRNYSGFVGWGGAFASLELDKDRWSSFINLSAARLSYSAEDYFIPKIIETTYDASVVDGGTGDTSFVSRDTTFKVAYGDTISLGDNNYTLNSPEAQDQRVDWIHLPTYTIKMGANFRINRNFSVFSNIGYFSKPPQFNFVIDNSTARNPDAFREREFYENEKIRALELGGKYQSPKFSSNINAYYTIWENKPFRNIISTLEDPTDPQSRRIPLDIAGVDARHVGVELDFAYKITQSLTLEGLISLGDWIWNSEEVAQYFTTVSGEPTLDTFSFDARGVHVGDAAQIQLGGMLRWEPTRNSYIKTRYTFFDKHYSNFQPEDLQGPNGGREVYKTPAYGILEFHAGYTFRFDSFQFRLRASVLNALDEFYISDANVNNVQTPGINTRDFDAKSTSVHFGMGRRWNISLEFNL